MNILNISEKVWNNPTTNNNNNCCWSKMTRRAMRMARIGDGESEPDSHRHK